MGVTSENEMLTTSRDGQRGGECANEKNLKISEYLMKLCRNMLAYFFDSQCIAEVHSGTHTPSSPLRPPPKKNNPFALFSTEPRR